MDPGPELEKLIRQMQEANLVASRMALHHEDRIKEHEEWLCHHERVFARMAESVAERDRQRAEDESRTGEWRAEHERWMAKIEQNLAEATDKLDGLIAAVDQMRQEFHARLKRLEGNGQ